MNNDAKTQAPLLDIDLLRTFVAIVETGSFSRAADVVFRSPGAVSMQVKRLEAMLEHPLLLRDPRRVQLTAAGETLLGYAQRMLAINDEAIGHFLAPDLSGRVRFGVTDDVGTRILPEVLARFARTHPSVQVDVLTGRSDALRGRLAEGALDLALVTCGPEARRHERTVFTEWLEWAGHEAGTVATRRPLPLALAAEGCIWRQMALTALEHAGIPFRIAYTSEHTSGQEAAAAADLAVAPLPRALIRAPLTILDATAGLPPIGRYRLALLKAPGATEAAVSLAERVSARLGARR